MRKRILFALTLCLPTSLPRAAERPPLQAASDALTRTHKTLLDPETVQYELPKSPAVVEEDLREFEGVLQYGWGHGHNLYLVKIQGRPDDLRIVRFRLDQAGRIPEAYPETGFRSRLETVCVSHAAFAPVLTTLRVLEQTRVRDSRAISNREAIRNDSDDIIDERLVLCKMSTNDFFILLAYGNDSALPEPFSFCDYSNSHDEIDYFLPKAKVLVLRSFLDALEWESPEAVSPELRAEFDLHFLQTFSAFENKDGWWWVRERLLKLASRYGTKRLVPTILPLLRFKGITDRVQYESASALAALTGTDFRFDSKNRVLPIATTRALYERMFHVPPAPDDPESAGPKDE